MRNTLMAVVMAAATLTACTYPVSQTKVVDDRPAITISGAPAGSQLVVDGLAMGPADSFASTRQVLKLPSGTHVVRIEQQGRVLHEEKVYLGDGVTRTVTVQGSK